MSSRTMSDGKPTFDGGAVSHEAADDSDISEDGSPLCDDENQQPRCSGEAMHCDKRSLK